MKRLAALLAVLVAPLAAQSPPVEEPITVEVAVPVARYPHDPDAFTEGLFIDRGELWESTGMVGRSSVRKVDLATGKVLKQAVIPPPYFGEGIVPWQGQILSLTWQNGTGFRWDRGSLRKRGSFKYSGEGWALTSNGSELIMSDGTDTLRFVDPKTFKVKRTLPVTVKGRPLKLLNELEWVNGQVLANVWKTNYVVRIDPVSGKVVGVIDLSQLRLESGATGYNQDTNGIAYDARTGKLYMTGKEWPVLFEVKLVPKQAAR